MAIAQMKPASSRAGDDDLLVGLAATGHPLPALVETLLAAPGALDHYRVLVAVAAGELAANLRAAGRVQARFDLQPADVAVADLGDRVLAPVTPEECLGGTSPTKAERHEGQAQSVADRGTSGPKPRPVVVDRRIPRGMEAIVDFVEIDDAQASVGTRVKRGDVVGVQALAVKPPLDIPPAWIRRPDRSYEKVVPVSGSQDGAVHMHGARGSRETSHDSHPDPRRASHAGIGAYQPAEIRVLVRNLGELPIAVVVVPVGDEVPFPGGRAKASSEPHGEVLPDGVAVRAIRRGALIKGSSG